MNRVGKGRARRLGWVSLLLTASVGLAGCPDDTPVELAILFTNDIHLHLHPPKGDPFGLGGMSRLATLLKERRAQRPLSITLDAGDYSESTWHYNIDTGANILRMFDVMGYDAVCVGNHDYLCRPDRMIETVKEAAPKFPILAANVDLSAYPKAEEWRRYHPESVILERGGLKIGIIGLTTVDYVFSFWFAPIVATEPVAKAQELAKKLRPEVDVLLILSHNFFDTNVQIGRAVAGVDAVISGHSHRKIGKAVLVQNAGRQVPVVEAGAWAKFLGELRLTVKKRKKHVAFAGYDLLPVVPTLAEDAAIRDRVAVEDAKLDRLYGGDVNEVVAHNEVSVEHDDSHHANTADLVTKAYRDITGADVAMEVLALTRVGLREGPVTVKDLHDVMPHILDFGSGKEWTIKLWSARGADLGLTANVVNFSNALPFENSGFIAFDNLEFTWTPKHEGNPVPKIETLTVGGQPLDVGRRYTVAVDDGLWLAIQQANEKFHLGMDLSQVQETGIEGWRAMLAYATKVGTFTEASLRAGSRTWTTIADPAIHHYAVEGTQAGVRVRVDNEGLGTSHGVRLACSAGLVDDLVAHETTEQVFTPIAEVDVPDLEPAASTWVEIPWQPVAGFWPVQCRLIAGVDGYPGNSTASAVLRK